MGARRLAGAATVALVLATSVVASPSASAAPMVGECYDVSAERLQAGGWWTPADPVPCTAPHTFEVTETGILPADVNAFEFAASQCGPLDVWARLGVNQTVAGIVRNPVRIEARSFGVREAPASYLCGAIAVSLNGRADPTPVTLTSSIERLGRKALTALRYCTSAEAGRSARAPMVSVPCSTRPRWEVTRWVVWTAFFDANPGRGALRQRAPELCGQGAQFTLPRAADWSGGLPLTWCYARVP